MKAQSSVEFLTIVGIALVLAAPFIIQAQDWMINVSLGTDAAEFRSSFDELDDAIKTMAAMGEPSKTTVRLNIPNNFVSARVVNDEALVFTRDQGGRSTNYTRIYDTKIYADQLPSERGSHEITVEAWQDQVNLTAPDLEN